VRSSLGKYILKYPHRNIQTARMLRKNMTNAERKLWSKLRSKQLGVKFRRQVPFGKYIADFMSLEVRLVVELDGYQHYMEEGIEKDKKRNEYFAAEGFKVLRFNNTEISENIDGVVESIWQALPHHKEDQ
jgi:very-short-patch-repair endonuclease